MASVFVSEDDLRERYSNLERHEKGKAEGRDFTKIPKEVGLVETKVGPHDKSNARNNRIGWKPFFQLKKSVMFYFNIWSLISPSLPKLF